MSQRKSLLNPYTESFAINKSCSMQSKALERLVNTAPTKNILSKFSLHSSITFMSTCWVLCDFLYAAKKRWKKHFYFRNQKISWKLLINFWESIQNTDWLEIWNRMLVFCLFIQRLDTGYFSVIGENILFKTIIYPYWNWCTQRLCSNFD